MKKRIIYCLSIITVLGCYSMNSGYDIRHTTLEDVPALVNLYRTVAEKRGGIARKPEEISTEYITDIVKKASKHGFVFVAEDHSKKELIGVIHAHRLEPLALSHTMGGATMLVHPEIHGRGIGKALLSNALRYVEESCPDVIRFELFVRESNERAIGLYSSLGFKHEGRLERRIISSSGNLEADLMMAWFPMRSKL